MAETLLKKRKAINQFKQIGTAKQNGPRAWFILTE